MIGVRRIAIVILALAGGLPSLAEGAESAGDLIERGIGLMRGRDYEGALRAFLDANAREPSSQAVAEIGLAEQALGRWADAEIHLTQAVAVPNDRWIDKYHAVLAAALAAVQGHLGSVLVEGTPRGAAIRFDSEVLGTIPLTLPSRVPIGQHALDVRADGYKPFSSPVTIAGGELRRVHVALEVETKRLVIEPLIEHAASASPRPREQAEEAVDRTASWIGIVGGVIVGVAGIVLYKLDDQRLGVGAVAVGGGAAVGATAGLFVVRFP